MYPADVLDAYVYTPCSLHYFDKTVHCKRYFDKTKAKNTQKFISILLSTCSESIFNIKRIRPTPFTFTFHRFHLKAERDSVTNGKIQRRKFRSSLCNLTTPSLSYNKLYSVSLQLAVNALESNTSHKDRRVARNLTFIF